MIKTITSVFEFIFGLIKYPLYIFVGIIILFMFLTFLNVFILRCRGQTVPHRRRRYGTSKFKSNFIYSLFVQAPKQYAIDMVSTPADYFRNQGCIIFTGRQGKGKTISLVKYALDLKLNYPKAKLISNLDIIGMDDKLNHWSKLVHYKNGKQGVICCIDETQNWFSSAQSKDFPPEMLSVITQNRKNRRIILGTAQSFHLLAKSIRSQATEIRECHTFAGVFTVVIKREPFLDSEGNVVKMKYRGMYCFAHDKQLRDSYDTWSVVDSLAKDGFIKRHERYNIDDLI